MRMIQARAPSRAAGSGGGGAAARRRQHQAAPEAASAAAVRPQLASLLHTPSSSRLASHSRALEAALEAHDDGTDVQAVVAAAAGSERQSDALDALGLAHAMVDVSVVVGDSLLEELGVDKGSRRLISVEERAEVLARLEGRESSVAAGGSLSNTLLALARLGEAGARAGVAAPLRVGFAGLLGSDPQGAFFASQMTRAGLEMVSPPTPGAATGTVVVLTTPDASRSMLSFLGTSAEVAVDAALEAAIARTRLLVVEGYLWELPGAQRTITQAIAAARRHGCVVAMTAGDAGVVARHGAAMWAAIDAGIDLLFTNAGEAAALLACEPQSSSAAAQAEGAAAPGQHCAAGEALALLLAPHCSMAVVTDGAAGSFVAALGEMHCVPPCWTKAAPVDTCGAGDAYAAGLLYGYLQGYDVVSMGRTAARAASAVIARHGAQLQPDAAAALAEGLPTHRGLATSASAAALAPTTPHATTAG